MEFRVLITGSDPSVRLAGPAELAELYRAFSAERATAETVEIHHDNPSDDMPSFLHMMGEGDQLTANRLDKCARCQGEGVHYIPADEDSGAYNRPCPDCNRKGHTDHRDRRRMDKRNAKRAA